MTDKVIQDAAAHLFWMEVQRTGFDSVVGIGKEDSMDIVQSPSLEKYLQQNGIQEPADQLSREFLSLVAGEIRDSIAQERNLYGVINLADCLAGRTDSVDVSALKGITSPVIVQGDGAVENVGMLCLRSPLPAVVHSPSRPNSSLIRVRDTSKALGLDYPVYLSLDGAQSIDNESYILTGIFMIPIRDETWNLHWNKLVPNSTRFHDGMTLATNTGPSKIVCRWDRSDADGEASIFKRLVRAIRS